MAQHDDFHHSAASKMIAILTSSLSLPESSRITVHVSDAAMVRLNAKLKAERQRAQREHREFFGAPIGAIGDGDFKTVNDMVEAAVESGTSLDLTRAMEALAVYALHQDLPMVAASQILSAHQAPVELFDKHSIDALFIPIRDHVLKQDDPQALMAFDIAHHFGISEPESLVLWEHMWNRVECAFLGTPLPPH